MLCNRHNRMNGNGCIYWRLKIFITPFKIKLSISEIVIVNAKRIIVFGAVISLPVSAYHAVKYVIISG